MAVTHPSRNRRQEILQAAAGLFARKGYDGTTIRNVAHACEITEAAIYRHFEGKTDLYEEVIRFKAGQHDLRQELQAFAGIGSVETVLTATANHILSLSKEDPELVRLMFSSHLEDAHGSVTLFREVRSPYIEFLMEELETRIASGELTRVDPFITARCFVGMVMDCALSAGVWSEVTGSDLKAENVVCNNVPIFARGLSRASGHVS
ncbi:TetR/AcrR family transcriptional regulator [bacterium]|nr:TetR/AcrR family transcriptional regulator [bacterium]